MTGANVFNQIPNIAKLKPFLLFVLRTIAIFLAFLFLKVTHRYLIDHSIDFTVSAYLRSFDAYQWMANAINYPSQWILTMLDYETILTERVISIVGSRGVEVQGPCMGFNIFSVFIALIISFPNKATFLQKGLFILAGILAIHLLNIFRVTALVLSKKYNYEFGINHHDLYNFIIYAFVIYLFYTWIKTFPVAFFNDKKD